MKLLLFWFIVAVVFLGGVAAILIRTAPDDPKQWHVDPLTVARPDTPNVYFLAPEGTVQAKTDGTGPVFKAPAEEVLAALDLHVRQQPRTFRLAGSPEEGWVTWVQKSDMLRFPDYITVRSVAMSEGQTGLAIFSRSRYGRSDLGVNKARVTAWLEALKPLQ